MSRTSRAMLIRLFRALFCFNVVFNRKSLWIMWVRCFAAKQRWLRNNQSWVSEKRKMWRKNFIFCTRVEQTFIRAALTKWIDSCKADARALHKLETRKRHAKRALLILVINNWKLSFQAVGEFTRPEITIFYLGLNENITTSNIYSTRGQTPRLCVWRNANISEMLHQSWRSLEDTRPTYWRTRNLGILIPLQLIRFASICDLRGSFYQSPIRSRLQETRKRRDARRSLPVPRIVTRAAREQLQLQTRFCVKLLVLQIDDKLQGFLDLNFMQCKNLFQGQLYPGCDLKLLLHFLHKFIIISMFKNAH